MYTKDHFKRRNRKFPGWTVVRTLQFHCQGPRGLMPIQGTKIPQSASQCFQKKKKKIRTKCRRPDLFLVDHILRVPRALALLWSLLVLRTEQSQLSFSRDSWGCWWEGEHSRLDLMSLFRVTKSGVKGAGV